MPHSPERSLRHAGRGLPRAAAALFAAIFTALTIPAFFQLPTDTSPSHAVAPVAMVSNGAF